MKCRLVNVVGNYHILITDAQYYGLKLYKKRFGRDEWVEEQFKHWFRGKHSVDLTPEEFLTIAGLTYFAPYNDNEPPHHHIMSAIKTASKKRKRVRLTGPKSRKRPTLEQEIQMVAHDTGDKGVTVIEAPPAPKTGDLSLEQQQERLTVKADDGNAMTALTIWLAGTYVGHSLATFGWLNVVNSVKEFATTGSHIFDMDALSTFIAAPWSFHPDAGGQLYEIYNTVAPIKEKVTNSLGNLPSGHPLSGISTNDLFKIFSMGDTAVMESGKTARDVFGKVNVAEFARNYLNDDSSLLALRGIGRFSRTRANPSRITNAVTAALHFDPTRKLKAITAMLYEHVTSNFLTSMISDITPDFIKEAVKSTEISKYIDARVILGDQSAAVLRDKIFSAISGIIMGTVGGLLQIGSLAMTTNELRLEIMKYKRGEKTKLKMALIKLLVDSDHAFTMASFATVSAVELLGATAAVNSGVALSTFAGPSSAASYYTTMTIKRLVNTQVRRMLGMSDSIELMTAKALIKTPGVAKSLAAKTVRLTKEGATKIGRGMVALTRKRQREVVDDVEEKFKRAKMALKNNDVGTSVGVCNKMAYNKKFVHKVLTQALFK